MLTLASYLYRLFCGFEERRCVKHFQPPGAVLVGVSPAQDRVDLLEPRARWMPAACSTKRPTVVRRPSIPLLGVRDREKSSFHRFQHKQEGPSAVGHKLPADLCASALSRPGHKSVIPADALTGRGRHLHRSRFLCSQNHVEPGIGAVVSHRAICSNSFIAPAHRFFHSF